MGIRIRRAMGWGMEWNAFEEATTLDCQTHETWDAVDEAMCKATDADLTMTMKERKESWNTRGITVVHDNRLLALDMTFDDEKPSMADGYRHRVEPKLAVADDLWTTVWNGDDITHVIFWPNARTAKKWFRRDDDLDYAFEAQRDGYGGDPAARDFVQFMKFNPYPYSNYIMEPDSGNPLEWVAFFELDREYEKTGWAPAPATELRWWLPKLSILDLAGVNKLRPMIAQWWS